MNWQQIPYNLASSAYRIGIKLASPWHKKAKKMEIGRANWARHLKENWHTLPTDNVLWMHCASLGEFEQGRPVLEAYRRKFPDHKILLTFFSPSGYDIRKNYPGANLVVYLPYDSPQNAAEFIRLAKPNLAIFVKYEFWAHYLLALDAANIPILLISAIFREKQAFFKPYGGFYRTLLKKYNRIFVQNTESATLLNNLTRQPAIIAGDTRFDRVLEIANQQTELDRIKEFVGGKPTLVVGSSWPADIEILIAIFNAYADKYSFIIAPHEVDSKSIANLQNQLSEYNTLLYTSINPSKSNHSSILILDTIGLLAGLYNYATWAYIGGSFGKGLHNTLEAAVWGIPVFFGNQNYQKFSEAVGLINAGGAWPIANSAELLSSLENLEPESQKYKLACQNSKNFVKQGAGATSLIVEYIEKLYAGK